VSGSCRKQCINAKDKLVSRGNSHLLFFGVLQAWWPRGRLYHILLMIMTAVAIVALIRLSNTYLSAFVISSTK
jgi:hypothetical protein